MTASTDAVIEERAPRALAREYEHDETEGERADVGHVLHGVNHKTQTHALPSRWRCSRSIDHPSRQARPRLLAGIHVSDTKSEEGHRVTVDAVRSDSVGGYGSLDRAGAPGRRPVRCREAERRGDGHDLGER